MKILFLDIDFVLNSSRWDKVRSIKEERYEPYFSELDPECMYRLKRVVTEVSGLQVVISSAWRENLTLQESKDLFKRFDFPADKIIDTTNPKVDKVQALEEYTKELNKGTEFLIIDDDFLFPLEHPLQRNFYKIPKVGLRDKDVVSIILKFK